MSRVYFDVQIGNEVSFRMIFELFWDSAPKTCENFKQLCLREAGEGYVGSKLHRVIENFMVQGGDYENGDGTGGASIYGKTFEDEDLERKHDQPLILSMANKGPDTNGSQFFITSVACPHLDGKHVVFGRVVKGQEGFQQIEAVDVDEEDRPLSPIVIINAGELVRKKKEAVVEDEVRVVETKLVDPEEEPQADEEGEEENPYKTGIAPPPEAEGPKSFLDRGTSKSSNFKVFHRNDEKDAAGRKVKGRGALKYGRDDRRDYRDRDRYSGDTDRRDRRRSRSRSPRR